MLSLFVSKELRLRGVTQHRSDGEMLRYEPEDQPLYAVTLYSSLQELITTL